MIQDSLLGAVYLSGIDMLLLLVFLYIMGLLFKLFPTINNISFAKKKVKKHDNN